MDHIRATAHGVVTGRDLALVEAAAAALDSSDAMAGTCADGRDFDAAHRLEELLRAVMSPWRPLEHADATAAAAARAGTYAPAA